MATRNAPLTLHFFVFDATTNKPVTGDTANIRAYWALDDSAPVMKPPTEVDATNMPGVYRVSITQLQANGTFGTLAGTSTTPDAVISPIGVQFERLPDAVPGGIGGVPTLDADARIDANLTGWGGVTLIGANMIENDGSNNSRWTIKALEQAWAVTTREVTSAAKITGDASAITMASPGVIDQVDKTVSVTNRVTADVTHWQGFAIPGSSMIENDGAGAGRYTAKALEQAPSGGGGGLTKQDVADAMRLTPTGTINTNSVDDKLDTLIAFSQNQESQETFRVSDVVTTGTQTGTSANTLAQDGTYWQLTSVAAGINAELVFNIGTSGQNPSAIRMWGRFDQSGGGKNRQAQMQAYNFASAAYQNVGDPLKNENFDTEYLFGLGRNFVRQGQTGTPGVDGDVRIRFLYDTTTSNTVQAGDNLYIDQASVFYTGESVTLGELFEALISANPNRNYPDSAIVIDAENGQPGKEFGKNGTPGNPVSNLADAIALAQIGGYERFIVQGNTPLTLTTALPDWDWQLAPGASIDFNSQNVDGSSFVGGTYTGVATAVGTGILIARGRLNGVTGWGIFNDCLLPQVGSLIANGNQVYLLDCESIQPGAANPSISGGSVAGLRLSVIKYGGGIDIGGLANDANVTVSGRGSVSFTDAASTATAIISGHMRLLGAQPTGFNLTDLARIDQG